jgi:chromosome partitioning protein
MLSSDPNSTKPMRVPLGDGSSGAADDTVELGPDWQRRSKRIEQRTPATRVVAVFNPRALVGSTTTATNFAAALSVLGKRVLVIDLDPRAHATIHLGLPLQKARATVKHFLAKQAGEAQLIHTIRDRLSLIPSGRDLSHFERQLEGFLGRDQLLQRRIAQGDWKFEYLIIDCPPSLGLLGMNGLSAADEVIIPTRVGATSIESLAQVRDALERIRTQLDKPTGTPRLVITRHDGRLPPYRETLEAAERAHFRVFRAVVRESMPLAEARFHGRDIFSYAARSPGAEDYLSLAKEYLHS